jgi:acid phosphatase
MPVRIYLVLTLLLALTAAGCAQPAPKPPTPAPPGATTPTTIPRPDHVLIVMEENRAYEQIIGSTDTPYINALAQKGALLTHSYAVAHPSQPNYLALFSGSTQGLKDDSCPHTYNGPNLGAELLNKGFTFTGYSETMPQTGFTGCEAGAYRRKHNPWVNFTNVPAEANQPLTAFPADLDKLPTLSFVIPDQNHDMHDSTAATADDWLKAHIDPYVQWAAGHNSLLILTFDEDDNHHENRITTILIGPMVKPGNYGDTYNHYSLLRTLSDMYGLTAPGAAAGVGALSGLWQ